MRSRFWPSRTSRLLLQVLTRYPEVLEQAAVNRAPHTLAHYLRELANAFHTYYNAQTFIVEEAQLRNARLALVLGVQEVLRNGLGLLGVRRRRACDPKRARARRSNWQQHVATTAATTSPRSDARLELRRLREFGCGLLGRRGARQHGVRLPRRPRRTGRRAARRTAPDPQSHGRRRIPRAPAAAPAKASENYDFYEMLPNFEVVVPEKDKDVKRDLPSTGKIERPGVYVLQAGSYRNEADAERVRAQLAMQGMRGQGAARGGRRRRLAPRARRPDQAI